MKTTMNNKPYTVIADCRKLSYDEWLKLRKSVNRIKESSTA